MYYRKQIMTPALVVLAALLVAIASTTGSAAEAPPPPRIGCGEELVAMSACLPHVAAPPNNATASPSAECCGTFSIVALNGAGGGAACLCYLVRDPYILGFPLNASRIASLFSSCDESDGAAASSFLEICQGSQELPPLRLSPPAGDAERTDPDTELVEASSPVVPSIPILPSATGPALDRCGRVQILAGALFFFLLPALAQL